MSDSSAIISALTKALPPGLRPHAAELAALLSELAAGLPPADAARRLAEKPGLIECLAALTGQQLDVAGRPLHVAGSPATLQHITISGGHVENIIGTAISIQLPFVNVSSENATRYLENLTPEELRSHIYSANSEIASAAIKVARAKVEQGELPISYLTRVHDHPYWLIRKLAIEAIIKINPPDTLELLHCFRRVSYQVSQSRIRTYIEQQFAEGKLTGDRCAMAREIVHDLAHAPKVTEESRDKDLRLLERIKDCHEQRGG